MDCVKRWLERSGERPARILLTDESTGREIDAAEAHLVESRVPAFAPAGCYIHVFASREEAERHAGAFGGRFRPAPGSGTTGGSTR